MQYVTMLYSRRRQQQPPPPLRPRRRQSVPKSVYRNPMLCHAAMVDTWRGGIQELYTLVDGATKCFWVDKQTDRPSLHKIGNSPRQYVCFMGFPVSLIWAVGHIKANLPYRCCGDLRTELSWTDREVSKCSGNKNTLDTQTETDKTEKKTQKISWARRQS